MDRDKEIRQAIEVLEDGLGEGLSQWESDELESYLDWRELIGADLLALPSDLQKRIRIIDQKVLIMQGLLSKEGGTRTEQEFHRRNLLNEFILKVHSILKTEEGQKYVKLCNEIYAFFDNVVSKVEFEKISSKDLWELARKGMSELRKIYSFIPNELKSTLGEDLLIYFFLLLTDPDPLASLKDTITNILVGEKALKELQKHLEKQRLGRNVAGLVLLLDTKKEWEDLMSLFKWEVKNMYHPLDVVWREGGKEREEEKVGELKVALAEEIENIQKQIPLDKGPLEVVLKMKEIILRAIEGEFNYIVKAVKNSFMDNVTKKFGAKKRQYVKMLSLDAMDEEDREAIGAQTPDIVRPLSERVLSIIKERHGSLAAKVVQVIWCSDSEMSQKEIAKEAGCTDRAVRKILAKLRKDEPFIMELLSLKE